MVLGPKLVVLVLQAYIVISSGALHPESPPSFEPYIGIETQSIARYSTSLNNVARILHIAILSCTSKIHAQGVLPSVEEEAEAEEEKNKAAIPTINTDETTRSPKKKKKKRKPSPVPDNKGIRRFMSEG